MGFEPVCAIKLQIHSLIYSPTYTCNSSHKEQHQTVSVTCLSLTNIMWHTLSLSILYSKARPSNGLFSTSSFEKTYRVLMGLHNIQIGIHTLRYVILVALTGMIIVFWSRKYIWRLIVSIWMLNATYFHMSGWALIKAGEHQHCIIRDDQHVFDKLWTQILFNSH